MQHDFLKEINNNNNNNNNIKTLVYFIGIGGSGMYPLAYILRKLGYLVAGSDNYISDTLSDALKTGLQIHTEHKPENIKGADIVVYSAAIKEDNPELKYARENNITVLTRAELLGFIMNRYKKLTAISGTHGKTTTSALLASILINAEFKPTAVIGGKLPLINGNSCLGFSDYAVCEACEYMDTFLSLTPAVSVVLNIEEDHMDYFKNVNNLVDSFNKFTSKSKELLVVNAEDKNVVNATTNVNVPIVGFCLNESSVNKNIKDKLTHIYSATNISETRGFYKFTALKNNSEFLNVKLKIPGKHNIDNALSAITVADYFKVPVKTTKESIESFTGVHRRFETLAKINNITVMDDFAHHPTEISATLDAVSKMGFKRVIAIFQPHTYSRTHMFLKEFADVLSKADLAIVSEILAVRENNVYGIHSEDLVNLIKNGIYLKTFSDITNYVVKAAKPGDLLLTMGGGNIYRCANSIVNKLKEIYGN